MQTEYNQLKGESMVTDSGKSAETVRRIQEIQRKIANHEANIKRTEQEKTQRVRMYDQQIQREQDEIKRYSREIDTLKRQI